MEKGGVGIGMDGLGWLWDGALFLSITAGCC